MTVLIVGAGALGKSLAGLLMPQADVMIYERHPQVRQALARHGLIFKHGRRTLTCKPQVVTSLKEIRGQKIDVLIVASKVMDLQAAVEQCGDLKPQCVFLPQNGLFDFKWVKRSFKNAVICRGTTTMACQSTGLNQVSLFYRGDMYVGGPGSSTVSKLFRSAGVKVKVVKDSTEAVWAKLIFSAVMNPLPVITDKGYSILRKDPEIWYLVQQAIKEGRATARALKIRLAFNPALLINRVHHGDLVNIPHRGSIMQDILSHRATEIDFITGALIKQANKVGLKTPALETILTLAKQAGA